MSFVSMDLFTQVYFIRTDYLHLAAETSPIRPTCVEIDTIVFATYPAPVDLKPPSLSL